MHWDRQRQTETETETETETILFIDIDYYMPVVSARPFCAFRTTAYVYFDCFKYELHCGLKNFEK